MKTIFLNFDGVLHSTLADVDDHFSNLPLLEPFRSISVAFALSKVIFFQDREGCTTRLNLGYVLL